MTPAVTIGHVCLSNVVQAASLVENQYTSLLLSCSVLLLVAKVVSHSVHTFTSLNHSELRTKISCSINH